MKLFFNLFVAFLLSLPVCMAEIAKGTLSPTFNLYVNAPLTEQDAVALSQGQKPKAQVFQVTPDKNGFVNIIKSGGKYAYKERTPALLEAVFVAENAGKIWFGAGADWWFSCFVNGNKIFSTMDFGNSVQPFGKDNYPFPVEVKKGENRIVLLVHSGSAGWGGAMGLMADPAEREKIDKLQLAFAPYLTHATSGSVIVNFISDKPAVAFVDYRVKGESTWNQAFDLLGGQVRIDETKHTVKLTGLKSDTVYEFRMGMKAKAHSAVEHHSAIYTFRSFTAAPKDFTVFYTSDTQFKLPERIQLLQDYIKNCNAGDADLFIHGGDVYHDYFDAKGVYLDSFLNVLTAGRTHCQPVIVTRGNHEYRGNESSDYFRYFGGRNNRSYGMFRQGNVCFIVLDTGEDKPRRPLDSWYARNFDMELMKEQREWLENAVKSPDFQTAQFRVVFSHSPGDEQYMGDAVKVMTEGLFTGSSPTHKIHFWVSAHTHRYTRTVAADGKAVRAVSNKVMVRESPAYGICAALVNDGPGGADGCDASAVKISCRANELEVQSMTRDGKVFDHFSILPDGSIKEHHSELKVIER